MHSTHIKSPVCHSIYKFGGKRGQIEGYLIVGARKSSQFWQACSPEWRASVLMQCAHWVAAKVTANRNLQRDLHAHHSILWEKKGTYRREVGQVPPANDPGRPQQVTLEASLQVRWSWDQRAGIKMERGGRPTNESAASRSPFWRLAAVKF